MNKEKILSALRHVMDPDLGKDLVTLNMIQDMKVEGNHVAFRLMLTTPACPLKNELREACVSAIHKHVSRDALVEVDFSSHTTSRRKENEEVMKGVKNIIAVGSGKGGVGKSTVAVNLAVAMSQAGAKVGLVDADIHGPSIPTMFGLVDAKGEGREVDGKTRLVQLEKYGLKLLSIGFFVDQSKALVWRGPMASTALKQLFTDSDWGELDYLVVDLPPGTGDIHLTLLQGFPVTGAIIVSTPQELAMADVRKAVDMFNVETLKVPILGLVENMSFFIPPDMPGKKYYIFGKEGCAKFAKQLNIPLLGQIPIEPEVTESGDKGYPIALVEGSPVAEAYKEIAANVVRQIAISNVVKEVFVRK